MAMPIAGSNPGYLLRTVRPSVDPYELGHMLTHVISYCLEHIAGNKRIVTASGWGDDPQASRSGMTVPMEPRILRSDPIGERTCIALRSFHISIGAFGKFRENGARHSRADRVAAPR